MSAQAASAPAAVARVDRAFGFIDLSGFTAFTATEGDDRAVDVLADFRAVVRSTAASLGVRIAKWLGDGAMLVAVDPALLVETVVEISRRLHGDDHLLPIRAGVARGPVILFEGDDHIGGAVNLASRLCDLAAPGEVLAPADVATIALPSNTVAVAVGSRPVRGLRDDVALVRLEPR